MTTSWASRSAAPTQPVQARSVVRRVATGSPAPSLRSQQPPSCIDAHEVMISSTVPHWLSPSLPNAPRDGADGGQPDHKHVEFTPLLGAEQRQQRNEDSPQHRVFQNFQSNLHRRYRSSLNSPAKPPAMPERIEA